MARSSAAPDPQDRQKLSVVDVPENRARINDRCRNEEDASLLIPDSTFVEPLDLAIHSLAVEYHIMCVLTKIV
jgi:hypothetical protein